MQLVSCNTSNICANVIKNCGYITHLSPDVLTVFSVHQHIAAITCKKGFFYPTITAINIIRIHCSEMGRDQ